MKYVCHSFVTLSTKQSIPQSPLQHNQPNTPSTFCLEFIYM